MHVHLDMLGGLAGDMFLAASLDADLCDRDAIETALQSLGLGDVRIVSEEAMRGAIAGTHVHFEGWDPEAESDHRHLSAILEMLERSDLPDEVADRAASMFRTLGEAESSIHDLPLEEVHFHECGALDSIFDFVSAAWILETSEASWSIGEVPIGSGTVETDHGTIPAPVPATVRLLEGFETVSRPVGTELVTPTGATILNELREISPDLERPDGTLQTSGWGAGTRQLEELSNVVRATIFETRDEATASESDTVHRVVTEIDDMNPEHLAEVDDRLFEAGALDVVREPVMMKKGRQGTRLSVLTPLGEIDDVLDALFESTTTFGVRLETVERRKLARALETIETEYGDVSVKVGRRRGEVVQVSPEHDDCVRLADAEGVSVDEIHRAAMAAWRR
jgi:uncharacterized protein (TIGR00299 family) protein